MNANDTISISSMEKDAIGEIMNISMGAAATALSLMLDKNVAITTPDVLIVPSIDFQFDALQPAIGVEINYMEGITGTNIMILKESDVKKIVGTLLQTDFSDTEFVMDEMSVSAICEVMNQMMGSSSTALSQFLNKPINISTPVSFTIDNSDDLKKKYFEHGEEILLVKFKLSIDEITNSEFAIVLPINLARELLGLFEQEIKMEQAKTDVEEKPKASLKSIKTDTPSPQKAANKNPVKTSVSESHEIKNADLPTYTERNESDVEQPDNLKLIMTVPVQITAEIGRTKKSIKEILELTTGSVVEFGTRAGTPVDILVNNQFIAKGDVVVVDEFYGVRITEIIKPNEIIEAI